MLKRTAEEQRKEVQQQISNEATEQFERFGVIQRSIQGTLSENRKEVNRQLKEFEQQMESKLETIQNVGMKSNEQCSISDICRWIALFLSMPKK